jgi:hypothetical protein
MITSQQILDLGHTVDDNSNNDPLFHFIGRKEKKDPLFGFADNFDYLLVYHPKTAVCLIRKRQGKIFKTLYNEQVTDIVDIVQAISNL